MRGEHYADFPYMSGDPTADELIVAGRRATARVEADPFQVGPAEEEVWKKLQAEDRAILITKRRQYGDSWKARGGTGAFHVGIRHADRINNMAQRCGYDIFAAMESLGTGDEGMLAAIGDLRRYLMLWEGEFQLRQSRRQT
jgi:hypothetical protein